MKFIHLVNILIGVVCIPVLIFSSYAIGSFGGGMFYQLLPVSLILLWMISYFLQFKTGDMRWMVLNVMVLLTVGCYVVYSVVS
ncbi:hypothetical protein [Pseudalkalibacillus decolorationis]|uniref:hypothetical protein n=1 Tax=Pseudalkalibacillus decolorationis TaxID=163879 RepID=UPI0021480FEF|nr:hypothetical protein [Pseudalkalibacillus decolorationis]